MVNTATVKGCTPTDSNLVETADDALKLMLESDKPNVKVMFDTIHALNRKEIPTDYVDKMRSNIIHVHISDLGRMPPGSHTDFSFLVEALKSIKYEGYLTMEIGLGDRGIDGNSLAKQALKYMRSLL